MPSCFRGEKEATTYLVMFPKSINIHTKECFDIKELSVKGHEQWTHMCYNNIRTYLLNDCLFTVARLGMSIHISIFLSPSCLLFLVISFLIDISRHNNAFIMKSAVKSRTKKLKTSFFISEYIHSYFSSL